jgi:signal transduction histidine kinase
VIVGGFVKVERIACLTRPHATGRHHLAARVAEQQGKALADEQRVVCDQIAARAGAGFSFAGESLWGAAILLIPGLAMFADLHASRVRIVEAADEERRRLERDLHDGAQQRLVGLVLALRHARTAPDADATCLAEAETSLRMAIDELRDLARGLYPVALREEGLAAALAGLSDARSYGWSNCAKADSRL